MAAALGAASCALNTKCVGLAMQPNMTHGSRLHIAEMLLTMLTATWSSAGGMGSLWSLPAPPPLLLQKSRHLHPPRLRIHFLKLAANGNVGAVVKWPQLAVQKRLARDVVRVLSVLAML